MPNLKYVRHMPRHARQRVNFAVRILQMPADERPRNVAILGAVREYEIPRLEPLPEFQQAFHILHPKFYPRY